VARLALTALAFMEEPAECIEDNALHLGRVALG